VKPRCLSQVRSSKANVSPWDQPQLLQDVAQESQEQSSSQSHWLQSWFRFSHPQDPWLGSQGRFSSTRLSQNFAREVRLPASGTIHLDPRKPKPGPGIIGARFRSAAAPRTGQDDPKPDPAVDGMGFQRLGLTIRRRICHTTTLITNMNICTHIKPTICMENHL
jgi:hypothetical protein